jgi:TonB family protein
LLPGGIVSFETSRRGFAKKLASPLLICLAIEELSAADEKGADNKKDDKNETADPVYEPGGDVKPPKLVHYIEPAVSTKSKEAFVEGTVRISAVVTSEGKPTGLHVVHGLNSEEDRTAVEAVTQWRFQPGTKNGRPVNVRVTVEVDFHLL